MLPDDPEDADPGLARERTRMAWVRTSIAFAAVGIVVLHRELAPGLLVLAAAPLVWGLGRIAARPPHAEQLARRLLLMTLVIIAVSLLAVAVAVFGHGPFSLGQLLHR